ncbi:MAG: hypothetical protein NTX26_03525 [Candidatus Parcubacteria bacterium]|nr:hypothetical protein [Candidatus Parcubacteria bacterium]
MALQTNSQFNNFPESFGSQIKELDKINRTNLDIGLSTERERAEQIVTAEIDRAINSLPDIDRTLSDALETGLKAADNRIPSTTEDTEAVEALVSTALANPSGIYDTVLKMRRGGELYLLDKFHDGLIDKLVEMQETLSNNK